MTPPTPESASHGGERISDVETGHSSNPLSGREFKPGMHVARGSASPITSMTPTRNDSSVTALATDPGVIDLALVVRDPEVVAYLARHDDGVPREQAAISALRIGVHALRQASGVIDAHAVRNEGDRLLAEMRAALASHAEKTAGEVSASLRQYLDPATGQLKIRLNDLLQSGGSLDQLLNRHVAPDNSTLASALAQRVGETSPLFKLLSPTQKDGLLDQVRTAIQTALDDQSKHIARQFSLADPQSALSVFKTQLTTVNGTLRDELRADVTRFHREFDLGNDDGALARLVRRVEDTQKKIAGEFTLDDSKSSLSRLKSEITTLLTHLRDRNDKFQTEVRAAVDSLKAAREQRENTTHAGRDFEGALCDELARESARLGDAFDRTGDRPGSIPRSKVGDAVIHLGAETAAPGRRIVIEAKREQKYSLVDARAEIADARKNRDADVGIFVFARDTAPTGIEPFSRHGDDLFVVWDHADPATDVFVRAAVSVARALVVRRKIEGDARDMDLTPIRNAVDRLQAAGESIGRITNWATTISARAGEINKESDRLRDDLAKQAEHLAECLKKLAASSGA
jgi:hypothetical protein